MRLLEAEKKSNVVQSLGEKKDTAQKRVKLTQKTILETAKASLARAEYEISKLVIKAPFAGVLEDNTSEIGSFLNIGSLCATIIDLSQIKLIGYIPELRLERFHLDPSLQVKLYQDYPQRKSKFYIQDKLIQ